MKRVMSEVEGRRLDRIKINSEETFYETENLGSLIRFVKHR